MKIIKSILILLFIIPLVVGCGQQNVVSKNNNSTVIPDFRNITWGMSKAEVKNAEKEAKFENDIEDILTYKTKIGITDYDLFYHFVDDKLFSAAYVKVGMVNVMGTGNNDSFFKEYEINKGILSEKYGNPLHDDITWKETFKDDPNYLGWAIANGHVVYNAEWETPNTDIGIMLDGVDLLTSIVIGYTSKEYYPLYEESIKKGL